jgi:plastocyanin
MVWTEEMSAPLKLEHLSRGRRMGGGRAIALILVALGLASCGGGGGDKTQMRPPACSLSPATLNFGSVALGSTKDLTFQITNAGEGTLSGTVGPCGDYTIQGANSYSLAAGASATFTVRFTPSQSGTRACALDLGTACSSMSCTGIGLGPCQVSPSALDFGTITPATTKDLTFTITNTGSGTLSGTASSTCGQFTIQGPASYSLAPTQSATITVRFTAGSGKACCTIETGSTDCPDLDCTGNGGVELSSATLGNGDTYSHTFACLGSYPYHCSIHSSMHGTVTVSAGGPANVSVSIPGLSFNPSSVTVGPGGTVTWTNNDNTNHTVTSD